MKKLFEEKSRMISKLFIYQFAMSLLGVFVVSPFNHNLRIVFGVFASLFYFSLISYAVVEDGQKDYISHTAGRLAGSPFCGLKYALVSYIPTIVITVAFSLIQLFSGEYALLTIKSILNIIIRFFLMGMYLGIETGVSRFDLDAVTLQRVSTAPDFVQYMSDKGLFFVAFLVLMPIVCGLAYYLAFKGKIHVNTSKKQK